MLSGRPLAPLRHSLRVLQNRLERTLTFTETSGSQLSMRGKFDTYRGEGSQRDRRFGSRTAGEVLLSIESHAQRIGEILKISRRIAFVVTASLFHLRMHNPDAKRNQVEPPE